MNIFVLSKHPGLAAEMVCNKHITKMPLEAAQLLCGVYERAPYRRTHFNHPCAKWTRASRANYNWLLMHAKALCIEYSRRYGRRHKSEDVVDWCVENKDSLNIPNIGLTPFAMAMPEKYRTHDVVSSYRAYYIGDKAHFASWTKRRPPTWFTV